MKYIIIPLLLAFISCKDFQERRYLVTYINNDVDTLAISGETKLSSGCIYSHVNRDNVVCGVKRYSELK